MLKIIISPAKKMRILEDYSCRLSAPVFQERAGQLHTALRNLSFEELKKLWNCSEKLAVQNYERLHAWVPGRHLTPALLAYEGIQYQYMAPHIFSESQWTYAEEHLRILSGFYGILRPTDGVIPYRLEMQAKLAPVREAFGSVNSLYEYWGDSIYRHLAAEMPADIDALQSTGPAAKAPADADSLQSVGPAAKTPPDEDSLQSVGPAAKTPPDADSLLSAGPAAKTPADADALQIVNLASDEYSKSVLPFIAPSVTWVSCIFGELADGRVKVKGTLAKMARGEMVRWMAENQIQDVRVLRDFRQLNYRFHEELSSDRAYVFLKSPEGGRQGVS